MKKIKKKFLGWNIFLSYSKTGDKIARKRGYSFLGWSIDLGRREVKVYRMWKMRDGPPKRKHEEED